MQKNKCVYELSLTKKEFVDILNRFREYSFSCKEGQVYRCNSCLKS